MEQPYHLLYPCIWRVPGYNRHTSHLRYSDASPTIQQLLQKSHTRAYGERLRKTYVSGKIEQSYSLSCRHPYFCSDPERSHGKAHNTQDGIDTTTNARFCFFVEASFPVHNLQSSWSWRFRRIFSFRQTFENFLPSVSCTGYTVCKAMTKALRFMKPLKTNA